LFADDLKICRTIINVDDCKFFSMIRIQCIIGIWLMVRKLMKVKTQSHLSVVKNSIYFNYKLCNNLVTRSHYVKDLDVCWTASFIFTNILIVYFRKV
jgi:hypothetical protein